jgi:hypothetical protein
MGYRSLYLSKNSSKLFVREVVGMWRERERERDVVFA